MSSSSQGLLHMLTDIELNSEIYFMLDIVQVDVHPKKYIRALHVNVYWKWYVRGSINKWC